MRIRAFEDEEDDGRRVLIRCWRQLNDECFFEELVLPV
jgi:hypothetical protein